MERQERRMIRKVMALMEQFHMVQEGDTIVVGVSGGADSVCLLHLLWEYGKRVPISLVAVHVNHKIRKEAAEDAAFVERLCEAMGLPFFLYEEAVEERAAKEKISTEEAGRKTRYEAFEKALQQYGNGKIAVAHHQGDVAETLLFHLFRGTGIHGMAGILPVRENIIRPLLTCSKEEIEEYLKTRGIPWCIDSTNEEDTYTRNRIRNHILPFAEENIVKGATAHLAEAALQMAGLREYLEAEREKAAADCVALKEAEGKAPSERNYLEISLKNWRKLPEFLRGEVLLWCMEQLVPGREDITAAHIRALRELTEREGCRKTDLPHGLEGVKEYDTLRIRKRNSEGWSKILFELEIPGEINLPGGWILEAELVDVPKDEIIKENQYTKYLDYDKINYYPVVRNRQQGDYLTINTALQKKSLKEYLIQEKIPAEERDRTFLLADGSHIMWVVGHRISAYYKVTEKTKHILRMKIRRE